MAELHVGHEVVAVGIHAEDLHQVGGLHAVALGLRHLLALGEQEAVAEHRVRDGQAGGHEHSRPDDAVEARDVLAHEVVLHGPALLELAGALLVAVADAREIGQQGVGPHVGHVALVEGQRHAPVEGGAADGQVLQAALHEGDHLVLARFRADEVGVLLVELQQRLLELGKLEEPVLLAAGLLHRAMAVGAHQLAVLVLLKVGLGVIGFLVHAVPTLVAALVAPALVEQVLPELLHGAGVARLGGAHEIGVGDVEQVPHVAERRLHGIAPGLRGHALRLGGIGHFLAMLVHTRDERHVVAVHALVARDGIGGDGGVGRAQMGLGVHVIDGRGERVGSL